MRDQIAQTLTIRDQIGQEMTIREERPETLSVADAAARLGISNTHARNLVRTNTFPVPVIRMGGVTRVPTAELDRILGIPHDAA